MYIDVHRRKSDSQATVPNLPLHPFDMTHSREDIGTFSRHLCPDIHINRARSPELKPSADGGEKALLRISPRALLSPSEINVGSPRTPIISVTDACADGKADQSAQLPVFLRTANSSYTKKPTVLSKPFQSPCRYHLPPAPRAMHGSHPLLTSDTLSAKPTPSYGKPKKVVSRQPALHSRRKIPPILQSLFK